MEHSVKADISYYRRVCHHLCQPLPSTTYTKTETDTLLGAKQDTISDLSTIRSNAQAGKAASDTIATYGNIVTHNVSEFATAAQGAKADTAVQPGDLATVATTGSYNDLSDKPTIPSITNRVNGAPLSNSASVFFGTSSTAAATVEKEVSIPSITTLDVGTVIVVQPTVTSTVANSTIKLNNFSAYPMRYNNAAITTSTDSVVWSASFPSIWVFDGTYWVFAGHGLDSNTTYTLNYSLDAGQYTAGSGTYAVTRYSILAQKADGTWEKITATNASYSTGTSKSVNTSGFILNQLRYYGTTTAVAGGVKIATNVMYEKSASVDMRYSTNCGGTTTWALGDYIYLVGTIGADGLFYLDTTTWWSNALPTTNDGKLYIRLGLSLTAAGYTISFFDDRPIFYHDGTGIKEYKVADNKQDVISDLATIRSGASAGATAVQPGDLATVATTGSYNDLSDKPTIPAAQVNSDWNANSGVAQILNKPTLATVATSGSYNDLSNKPTIPTVNNPTITITQGGVTKGSFTLNQATGDTIALDAGGGGGSADIDNLTITENADQEIQAVAVIDQNTGIAKTWTGTMAEYEAIVTKDPETEYIITDDIGGSATEIGEITEALNDKVDKGHQVIEFQEPTAANNYTWYRKYADGWVEQGGQTSGGGEAVTVTLPVAMADANYGGFVSYLVAINSTEWTSYVNGFTSRTTTTIGYNSKTGNARYWQVSGMAA